MSDMRGFIFTIDMVYGAVVVILLFSLMIHASKPPFFPQQQLLQIQAKDQVLAWFYGAAPGLDQCGASFKACACDTGFRPAVTTAPLSPNALGSWVSRTVCVESP